MGADKTADDGPRTTLRRHPTLEDVATLAGVSVKTVSRVVNGEPNVSRQTGLRVKAAIRQLNYSPDLSASRLRSNRALHSTIGIMLGSPANPFSTRLQAAVEDVAAERKTMVLTGSLASGDPARERWTIDTMIGRRLDGILLVTPTRSHGYLRAEQERGMVVGFVDGIPMGVVADAVLSDNYEGGALATRHLIAHGHRRIAMLGAKPGIVTDDERRRGYIDAMAASQLSDQVVVVEDLDESTATDACLALLASPSPPSAVFSAQNLVALGVARALRRAGAAHSVAHVGFDDVEGGDLFEPGLTVIAQDPAALGRTAAQTLFRRLDGDVFPVETRRLPVRLLPRGSGELPADARS